MIAALLFAYLLQFVSPAQAANTVAEKAFSLHDYAGAVDLYQRAIELDPFNVDYYLSRARALAQIDRYQEAIDTCTRAAAVVPLDTRALVDRGHYYINIGRIDLALADLTRVESMQKEVIIRPLLDDDDIYRAKARDYQLWLHLGLARYLAGQFGAAADTFEKCLRASRYRESYECGGAWPYLALRRAGRDEDARRLLAKSWTLPMRFVPGPHFRLLDSQFLFKGVPLDTDVTSWVPSDPMYRAGSAYSIGIWYLLNGRTEQARTYFAIAAAPPSDPKTFSAVAATIELQRMKP